MRNPKKHGKRFLAVGDNARNVCTNCGITFLEKNQLPLCTSCLSHLSGYLIFARDAARGADFKPVRYRENRLFDFLG